MAKKHKINISGLSAVKARSEIADSPLRLIILLQLKLLHSEKEFTMLQNQKPIPLRVNPHQIPTTLKRYQSWVCWAYVKARPNHDGSPPKKAWTKVPINAWGGEYASVTRPHTWSDFSNCYCRWENNMNTLSGIGFVLATKGIVGIDLDNCRDKATGQIQVWASDIINKVNSYSEVSPSGTGIRIFCLGVN